MGKKPEHDGQEKKKTNYEKPVLMEYNTRRAAGETCFTGSGASSTCIGGNVATSACGVGTSGA